MKRLAEHAAVHQDRNAETADELWIVEHFPVYTLGLNGKREHLLSTGSIPVLILTGADKSPIMLQDS